jgi:hypothetical protein
MAMLHLIMLLLMLMLLILLRKLEAKGARRPN